jgi:hypothetical protein
MIRNRIMKKDNFNFFLQFEILLATLNQNTMSSRHGKKYFNWFEGLV